LGRLTIHSGQTYSQLLQRALAVLLNFTWAKFILGCYSYGYLVTVSLFYFISLVMFYLVLGKVLAERCERSGGKFGRRGKRTLIHL
jgi:hypothetical protein